MPVPTLSPCKHFINPNPTPSNSPPQGEADMKVVVGGRRYELTVSTHSMCVLLLFNDQDELSYR